MTRVEYDLLRNEWPDLKLPSWTLLWEHTRHQVLSMNREQVIAWVIEQKLKGNEDWKYSFMGSRSKAFQ